MKSNSTMMWLTMTPIRLTTPRNAMNPNGVPISQSAASAPTTPYGIAAKTMSGLIACLNWKTSAR